MSLSSSRVFFLCPDVAHPTGGVTKIYEFAAALRNHGFNSVVVHRNPGYRLSWFSSDVPVVSRARTVVEPNDLLVIPEFMGDVIPKLKGCTKIVLYQASFNPADAHFSDEQVVSLITVSDYIQRYASFAHPRANSLRIRMGYDSFTFFPDFSKKKKQIAYMPRRRADDSRRILKALERRGSLKGWSVVAMDGLNASEVANLLRESAIFLSFSQREGFGLPPLEAMACGCLVVGFHGHGGVEFFDPSYCYPIPEDDICLFQETLESLLLNPQIESFCHVKGHAAASAVSQKYTMQRQTNDVIKAFSSCMALAKDVKGLKQVALRHIEFEPSRFRASARHLKQAFVSLLS